MQNKAYRLLTAGMATALLMVWGSTDTAAAEPKFERYRWSQIQMGMPVELVLYAADQPSANMAAEAAFGRIHQLNGLMSDYDPTSELSRLSDTAGQGRAVPISEELWFVLDRARQLSAASDGSFDITVGPIVKLWRRARREKEFPPANRLREALATVGYQNLQLDPNNRTAKLLRPGMRLDLGGIAMGYANDEVLALLKKRGITQVLIDGSGDILVGDPPPGTDGWKIGIAPLTAKDGPPSRYIRLANYAVTTSGDAWQHVELGGKRYSHIVDPHTGLGLTVRSSVTVIAPECITADSLTKAVAVLGPLKGLELVEQTPGAAAFIACMEDGQLKTYESRRLKDFLIEK